MRVQFINLKKLPNYIYYMFLITCILLTGLLLLNSDDSVIETFNDVIADKVENNCISNIGSCIQDEEEKIRKLEARFISPSSHDYLNEKQRKIY